MTLKEILAALGLSATNTKTLLQELKAKPIALYNAETGEFARWLPLIVPDENNILHSTKGSWPVNQDSIVANFKVRGIEMVIDYEHASLGDKDGNPIPAPASGWIQDIANMYGIIFALVDWTPRARDFIANREYKYLSPTFGTDETGAMVVVFNVGLTNNPATINAIPISLSASGEIIRAAESGKETSKMEKATLIAMLGLSASATDADIAQAIGALRDGHSRTASALSLAATASLAEIEGKITALAANSSQLATAQAELTKLQNEAKAKAATAMVEAALTAGKITPAQKDWANGYALSSPDGFAAYVASAQVIVPLGAGLAPNGAGSVTTLSDIERTLGITEEDKKKHGGQA